MLKFNGAWRFKSPGSIAGGVESEFSRMIGRIASQGDRQPILEHFKAYFAGAAGVSSSWSSSASWAETDLYNYMTHAAENAPLFIEAFYDACMTLQTAHPEIFVPDTTMINNVLAEHGAGYYIQPPDLVAQNPDTSIAVPERVRSVDEQAQDIIQKALKQSEDYLALGHYRQAVQEILWLLETVSTLFQDLAIGEETVQGKYFNKIADDLRRYQKGTTFEQVLVWATTLHGYLSSPTGGGIRHGASLRASIAMQGMRPDCSVTLFAVTSPLC